MENKSYLNYFLSFEKYFPRTIKKTHLGNLKIFSKTSKWILCCLMWRIFFLRPPKITLQVRHWLYATIILAVYLTFFYYFNVFYKIEIPKSPTKNVSFIFLPRKTMDSSDLSIRLNWQNLASCLQIRDWNRY